ncbi:unnamed protein product [Linum tenue]|uniref:Uncharacterized protein n=1 Tax=Linum tenue TaxID=586396 RepID=A0AAV0Q8M0_9ROSI|nr:unnamed protein product [Linum tenue]
MVLAVSNTLAGIPWSIISCDLKKGQNTLLFTA